VDEDRRDQSPWEDLDSLDSLDGPDPPYDDATGPLLDPGPVDAFPPGPGPLDEGDEWAGPESGEAELPRPIPPARLAAIVIAACLAVAAAFFLLRGPAPEEPPAAAKAPAAPVEAAAVPPGQTAEAAGEAPAAPAPATAPVPDLDLSQPQPSHFGVWDFAPGGAPPVETLAAQAESPPPERTPAADFPPTGLLPDPGQELSSDPVAAPLEPPPAAAPEESGLEGSAGGQGDFSSVSESLGLRRSAAPPPMEDPAAPGELIILSPEEWAALEAAKAPAGGLGEEEEEAEPPLESSGAEALAVAPDAGEAPSPALEPEPLPEPPAASEAAEPSAPDLEASPAPDPEPEPASEPPATAEAGEAAISDLWVANLISTSDPQTADKVWALLSGKAGAARLYRYEAEVGGSPVHRIRVGFFEDRESALAKGQELAAIGSLGDPWASRPNLAEVRRFYGDELSDLWAVNLSSTQDEAESQAVWAALSAASSALAGLDSQKAPGLPALGLYRYQAVVDGAPRYRIRLGFFESGPAAEAAGRALAEAAGLPESRIGRPWAVRPAAGEVLAHRRG
jgi:hypothetical protein